jgi:hypothetical protein
MRGCPCLPVEDDEGPEDEAEEGKDEDDCEGEERLPVYRWRMTRGRRTKQKRARTRMTVRDEERPLAAARRHLYMSNQFFSPSTMFRNSSSNLNIAFLARRESVHSRRLLRICTLSFVST